jgi:predicted outer membrane protein
VNVLEIELGRLAQSNAAQPEVKAYGERMMKAHTRMDAREASTPRSTS